MHLFTKISYLFIKVIGLFAKKCYIANALAKKKKKISYENEFKGIYTLTTNTDKANTEKF